MSLAKAADWELSVPGSARLPLVARKSAGTLGRRAVGHGNGLYRPPALPVCVGEEPGGATVSLGKFQDDTRDWRKLQTREIAEYFENLEASLQPSRNPRVYATSTRRHPEETAQFKGLMAAVAVGTLQACSEGSYWSPCFQEGAVQCRDVRRPVSRVVAATSSLPQVDPRGAPQISVDSEICPLETCRALACEAQHPRVALVRFVPLGDVQHASTSSLGDFRGAQLQMRTTYLQGLREMSRHAHVDPTQAMESGAVLHTADVTILRGPVEMGATWLEDAPRIDVLTVAIQRHPRIDDQGQYARISEKAQLAETIDRLFACAVMCGVEALVFPPLGVGNAASCHHPAADAGDLLRKACLAHGDHIPRVFICKEHKDQLPGDWAIFAAAAASGREPPEHRELVPLAASPFVRPGWVPKSTPRSSSRFRRPPGARCIGGALAGQPCAALGAAGLAIAT